MTKSNPYLIGLASFLVTVLALAPEQPRAAPAAAVAEARAY